MAAEFQLFRPRKYAAEADWKADCKTKVAAFRELEKVGAERRDDVQYFLGEVIWAVIRGELTVARAVEFLSMTPIPSRAPLQRLFADVLWLVGFAATEVPPDKGMRDDFYALCSQLEKEVLLPRTVIAQTLETDSMPQAVCQVMALRKKHNQAKTKARYTITRFNLLREHTEGYAKLLFLLDRLAHLDFEPKATPEQIDQTTNGLVQDVVRLAGFNHLCPNRILAMAIDILEKRLMEVDTSPLRQPLLALLRHFPKKRLTEVVVFQVLAHAPAPASGRDGRPVQPPPAPSRPSQFLAIATLISVGFVDLDVLWTYLDPTDATLKQAHADLMLKHEDEVASLSKVDLGSSSSNARDCNSFGRAFQNFNQAGHPKFRLVAALVSVNSWRHAHRALLHLEKLCKPCLNHNIRSALCDLLKWLVAPLLRPTSKRSPLRSKYLLETSYRCTRRFGYGPAVGALQCEGGEKDVVSEALRPITELEQLVPQIRQVLDHLEYFLHTDLHLLHSLWNVLLLCLKQRERGNSPNAVLDDTLVGIVYRHLLPAASLVPHNPQLSELMWSVMQQLSVFQRFLIYSCWETMYDSFLLKYVQEKTKSATKQILRRVVANAERRDLIAHQAHFHFCKLCHSNPMPAIETMLRDIEIGFNVNMIQPYVECTSRCPDMTADVMGFMLSRSCAKPATPTRVFLSQADANLSPWLVNLGEFVGRFYKKHPHTDLYGLLSVIAKRVNNEATEASMALPGQPPPEYKGESLIRVVLENLIEYMGGYLTVTDMNDEQLYCLAGGPRLRSESIACGKKEDSSRKERSRQALFNALVNLGLIPVLWYSLSQQRHHFLSEEFSEAHGGAGGLKLLGLLFDGNHDCFLTVTEFLAQACTPQKYMSLIPPFEEVFSMFDPSLAFMVIRPGLAPYGRLTAPTPAAAAAPEATDTAAAVAGGSGVGVAAPAPVPATAPPAVEASDTAKPPEAGAPNATGGGVPDANAGTAAKATIVEPPIIEDKSIQDLERVISLYLPADFEELWGISRQFYTTFWRLSLQDIFIPTDGYERNIAQISVNIKSIETQKKSMERDRDHAHSRDYKSLKKEGVRLQDFHSKFKEEMLMQQCTHRGVITRLKREKNSWFTKPGPDATAAFVADMLCPRVLTSYSDALFCCHFVRLIIKLKTPGLNFLDFYNIWTIMLTQCIRCSSEREAHIFGVFLKDMMSYVVQLRSDEKFFLDELKDNPCFYRHYTCREGLAPDQIEFSQFGDIRKGHSKWEGRIFRAVKAGLDSEDWMEKRNALLLLSQCYTAFPVVERYAMATLSSIDAISQKEEFSDIKTLAASLAVKLRSQRENWVDKTTSIADQHSRRRPSKDPNRRAKNPLGPAQGAERAKDPREPKEHKDKEVKEQKEVREPKEVKEPKESKEKDGKMRDRADSKAVKEAREGKEVRTSDKISADGGKRSAAVEPDGAPADRRPRREGDDEPKRSTAEKPREKDGKRSSGTSSTAAGAGAPPQATAHSEDRLEKRRRTERDGDVGHSGTVVSNRGSTGSAAVPSTGDRGSGDRHGGSYSGHQARNALNAPEPAPSSSQYYSRAPSSHENYNRRSTGYPSGHTSSHSGRYADQHRHQRSR